MIDNLSSVMHVLYYRIRVRDSQTGFWRTIKRIHPEYLHKKVHRTKRFLWWTWEVETETIPNESKARTVARVEALKEATLLRASGQDVKVHLIHQRHWDGQPYESDRLVWQNGQWVD